MVGRSILAFLATALLLAAVPVHAAPKNKWKPAAAAPKTKKTKPAEAGKAKSKEKDSEREQEKDKEAEQPDEKSSAQESTASGSKEDAVKSAGTTAAKAQDSASVKVKEDKEGVKTYKFEAIEVEGRLKSPQVIYFLRRVRAEFDAGALGHRSFLGELSDSRRSPALR